MVAYSFKRRFIEAIVTGAKRQTIRADRNRHAHKGELLQLYTGMRTKQCRAIGIAECELVVPIRLILAHVGSIQVEGVPFPGSLDEFAQADGFEKWSDLVYFWEVNHPDMPVFSGVLIRWRDFIAAAK